MNRINSDINESLEYLQNQVKPNCNNQNLILNNSIIQSNECLAYFQEFLQFNQQITVLHLSFSKDISSNILIGLFKLDNLNKLYLTFKNLKIDGDLFFQMIERLCNQEKLKHLEIQMEYCQFTQFTDLTKMNNFFLSLSNLTSLTINSEDCRYDYLGFTNLTNSILANPSMKNVNITVNFPFYEPDSDSESGEIQQINNQNDNYQIINAVNNSIDSLILKLVPDDFTNASDIFKISYSFQYLPNLTYLDIDISLQYIKINGFTIFLSNLALLAQLTQLKLLVKGSNINNEALEILFKSLSCLKKLKDLFIQFQEDQIDNEGFQAIKLLFSNCVDLQKLDISFINCEENLVLTDLAESLALATNLKYLCLECENLQNKDDFAQIFGQSLQNLKYINVLRMFFVNNQITDKGLQCISDGIESLSDLQQISIHLSENFITHLGVAYLREKLMDKQKNLINLDQDFWWNQNEQNQQNLQEIMIFQDNQISNLQYELRYLQINQQIANQLYQSIMISNKIDTLILDIRSQIFTLNPQNPLPVSHLPQLKRLYIFSDFYQINEKIRLQQFMMRKAKRLLEFLITNQDIE